MIGSAAGAGGRDGDIALGCEEVPGGRGWGKTVYRAYKQD
jgi:hypothetical protein